MPLSVDNVIIATDIDHIAMFKELKVWRLTGNNNDSIVIKTDAVFQPQIKSASPAVKAIAPGAKFKVLSPGELQALKAYIASYEEIHKAYQDFGMSYRPDEAEAIKSLKESMTFGFAFVKMAYVKVSTLDNALESRLKGDKTDLRAFTDTLNAPGGLERLGKIIAVDLFIGNTDRFFPACLADKPPDIKPIGGIKFNVRCLVNVGNVFRAVNQGGSEMAALDFVDPQSEFKDINTPLAQAEPRATRSGKTWPARILLDKTKRKDFAKDIVHDLELLLNPHKSRFSLQTKLKSDAADRLVKGMIQGAQLIKDKLELKYNPNGWTPGILDRHQIICRVA